jgi:hypothetical protein
MTKREKDRSGSIPDLVIDDQGPNTITFCSELERTKKGELDPNIVASITLEGGDETWGEFFDQEDLNNLRNWLNAYFPEQT